MFLGSYSALWWSSSVEEGSVFRGFGLYLEAHGLVFGFCGITDSSLTRRHQFRPLVGAGPVCTDRFTDLALYTMLPRQEHTADLKAPKKVFKIQLAFRKDGYQWQGKNVRVQVGSSPGYNANNPVCTEIAQLKDSSHGLVDYYCDQIHEGQYVTMSNDQSFITICEAKVFAEEGKYGETTYQTNPKYF